METSNRPKGRSFETLNELIDYQLLGTDYGGNDSALYRIERFRDKDGEEQTNTKYLANGVLILGCNRKRDDGVTVENSLIVIPIVEGKRLSPCEIPVEDLENKLMIHLPLNFRPTVGGNSKAFIVDSIRAQTKNSHEEVIYEHTGWRKLNGEWVFLCADGAITKDGINREIQTDLTGRNSQYSFTEDREDGRWETNNKFLKVAPPPVMLPLLAMVALSPLNEALRMAGCEPAFMLFLVGRTGSKKSTLAALALNYYGKNFNNKSLPGSSKDTVNSLEKNGFILKDVLTVIDDFFPATNHLESSKMETTLQGVARMYGDRTGKNRMFANGKNRPNNPVRGNAILTGEDVPHVGQSGEARFLGVEVQSDDVKMDVLSEVQESPNCLNEIFCEYIQWLAPNYDTLPDILGKRFLELRAKAQNGGHGRVAESIAHLQLGIEMWSKFLREKGQLAQVETMQDKAWEIFKDLAEKQNKAIAEEQPTKLFLDAFKELLETRVISLADVSRSELWQHQVGWKDDRFIYLKLDTTLNAVYRFYEEQGKKFPLTSKRLLKHLRDEGLILPDENGGNTRKKKICGKPKSTVWLYSSAVDIPCEEAEDDEK